MLVVIMRNMAVDIKPIGSVRLAFVGPCVLITLQSADYNNGSDFPMRNSASNASTVHSNFGG